MTRNRLVAGLATAALAASLLSIAPARADERPHPFKAPKQFYLSLGHSDAFGFQGRRFGEMFDAGTYTPDAFNTGYTDVFGALMRRIRPHQTTVNLSCPGESLDTMIHGGCFFTQDLGLALHTDYSGSQLDAAVAFLHGHPGKVSPITLSITGNDIEQVFESCDLRPRCIAHSGLRANLRTNLGHILDALHAAAPRAQIIVLALFNPFNPPLPRSDRLWAPTVRETIRIATQHHARAVNAFALVDSDGPARICRLTLLCADQDLHPSDRGYALLAHRLFDVAGYADLLRN